MLDEPICELADVERASGIPNVGYCKLKLKRFGGLDLLRERVPIRDLETVLRKSGDLGLEGYRAAVLGLTLAGFDGGSAIGAAAEKAQPDEDLCGRGTLLHRRWSGEDPAIFFADQGIRLDVSCASPTDALDVPLPYALAVTLEVGVASEIDVYTEIKARIGLPIEGWDELRTRTPGKLEDFRTPKHLEG
jgi:hypothetical protein